MTDRRRQDEIAELRSSVENLGKQTENLSGAIQGINKIIAAQQRIEQAAKEAAATVREVKEDLDENVKPTQFSQGGQIDAQIKQLQLLRRSVWVACVLAMLVGIVASLVSFEVGRYERHKTIRATNEAIATANASILAIQGERSRSCQTSNKSKRDAAHEERQAFMPFYVQEAGNPNADPVLLAILKGLAHARPVALTDCKAAVAAIPTASPTATP